MGRMRANGSLSTACARLSNAHAWNELGWMFVREFVPIRRAQGLLMAGDSTRPRLAQAAHSICKIGAAKSDDLTYLPSREPLAVSGHAFVYILACSDGTL
jgi:hypothetical protein